MVVRNDRISVKKKEKRKRKERKRKKETRKRVLRQCDELLISPNDGVAACLIVCWRALVGVRKIWRACRRSVGSRRVASWLSSSRFSSRDIVINAPSPEERRRSRTRGDRVSSIDPRRSIHSKSSHDPRRFDSRAIDKHSTNVDGKSTDD